MAALALARGGADALVGAAGGAARAFGAAAHAVGDPLVAAIGAADGGHDGHESDSSDDGHTDSEEVDGVDAYESMWRRREKEQRERAAAGLASDVSAAVRGEPLSKNAAGEGLSRIAGSGGASSIHGISRQRTQSGMVPPTPEPPMVSAKPIHSPHTLANDEPRAKGLPPPWSNKQPRATTGHRAHSHARAPSSYATAEQLCASMVSLERSGGSLHQGLAKSTKDLAIDVSLQDAQEGDQKKSSHRRTFFGVLPVPPIGKLMRKARGRKEVTELDARPVVVPKDADGLTTTPTGGPQTRDADVPTPERCRHVHPGSRHGDATAIVTAASRSSEGATESGVGASAVEAVSHDIGRGVTRKRTLGEKIEVAADVGMKLALGLMALSLVSSGVTSMRRRRQRRDIVIVNNMGLAKAFPLRH